MRSKARSSAGCDGDAEIGERVADLLALVEARAADDAVGQAERDEAVLEVAHLEAEARTRMAISAERVALALQRLDLLADAARLLLAVPGAGDGRPSRLGSSSVQQRLAEAALVVGDEAEAAARMWPVER